MLRILRGDNGRRAYGARAESSCWRLDGSGGRVRAARQSRAAGEGFIFERTSRRRRGFAAPTIKLGEATPRPAASFWACAAKPRLAGFLDRNAQHFGRKERSEACS